MKSNSPCEVRRRCIYQRKGDPMMSLGLGVWLSAGIHSYAPLLLLWRVCTHVQVECTASVQDAELLLSTNHGSRTATPCAAPPPHGPSKPDINLQRGCDTADFWLQRPPRRAAGAAAGGGAAPLRPQQRGPRGSCSMPRGGGWGIFQIANADSD